MITADDIDLRIGLEALRQQGGGELALGPKTYIVPGGFTWVPPRNFSLRGEYGATRIKIVGNGDFTIGDGNNEVLNPRIDGIHIMADGPRDGWALRCQKFVRAVLRDVTIDPVEIGWRNQFGLWIDGFDDMTLDNVGANARTKSLLMNGKKGQGYGADLYLGGGGKFTTFRQPEPAPGEAAIHIAGGCGGIHLEAADVIYSDVDLQIDTAMTGESNREIFLGTGLYFDSAGSDCVRIGPKACSTLQANGTWFASAGLLSGGYPNGNGINVHWDNAGLVGVLSGIKAFNCRGTGIALSGGHWRVGGASAIHNNGGYGIDKANGAAAVEVGDVMGFVNAMGNRHNC